MFGSDGEKKLQETYGTVKRANSFYDNQVIDNINNIMKEFISNQEMMFISTSDSQGNCDSSFRAGEKGFVKVINEKTIIYPEYSGNGVMASLGNISENPHIGILFIDFFEHQIGLHINGSAAIIENEQIVDLLSLDSNNNQTNHVEKPTRWVKINVHEAYIHCSRMIPKLSTIDKASNEKKHGDFFKTKNKIDNSI